MIDAFLFLFVSQSVCRNSVLNEFDFGIIFKEYKNECKIGFFKGLNGCRIGFGL